MKPLSRITRLNNPSYTALSDAAPAPKFASTNGKWIAKGELDAPCTSVPVSDLKNISQLKISWNKDNIPVLYEIMPIGEPYVEEVSPPTGILSETSSSNASIFIEGNYVRIESRILIERIIITDLSGQKIKDINVNQNSIEIPIHEKQVLIVNAYLNNNKTVTAKVAR